MEGSLCRFGLILTDYRGSRKFQFVCGEFPIHSEDFRVLARDGFHRRTKRDNRAECGSKFRESC